MLADQFCYLVSHPAGIHGVTIRDYYRMSGRLYSIIMSGLQFNRYRLRNYVNLISGLPQQQYTLRLLGCLSFESSPSDAVLNRNERLRNIGNLHVSVNPQVTISTRL